MVEHLSAPAAHDGLSLGRNGAAAVAVLRRPEQANALSPAMQRAFAGWYPVLARDPGIYCALIRSDLDGMFSAGSLDEDWPASAADPAARRQALARTLQLGWRAECFTKPTVSLIDGPVTGAGIAVTLFGTHRVAGEGYRLGLAGASPGGVPMLGLAHVLARLPHSIGLYLALTGAEIGRADAHRLGLATHCIQRAEFAAIEPRLAEADPVDPLLDDRHRDPGEGPVCGMAQRIEHYFGAPTLSEAVIRLGAARASDLDWAASVLTALARRPPMALALADRSIRNAAALDLRSTLIQDYRVGWRLAEGGAGPARGGPEASDGREAETPRYARLEEIPGAVVDAYFASLGEEELILPSRSEMQSGRLEAGTI